MRDKVVNGFYKAIGGGMGLSGCVGRMLRKSRDRASDIVLEDGTGS